jgi:hypothetical protein
MEIKGKIIQILPTQTGEGKNGPWKKQEFVLETEGQYPKKVCIAAWGDKINDGLLQVGNEVNVSFDIESREYNGKWYTDVKAWRVDAATGETSQPAYEPRAAATTPAAPSFVASDLAGGDDLPF